MKRLWILLLCACFLSGCSASTRIENQAHAVSIGLDLEGGEIRMSAQVPTIGGESPKGEGGVSAVSYSVYSAVGRDFPSAYALLTATIPEKLNLTQLKIIVISQSLAESDEFHPLLTEIMRSYELSAAATVIVSRSTALEMLKNQRTLIGTHLSVSMPAMLENFEKSGYIPITNLSALYAGMNGTYSTQKAALGSVSEDAVSGSLIAGTLNRDGENKNEYMGCALFGREKMVGVLNGYETQLMRLLEGKRVKLSSVRGFSTVSAEPLGRPRADILTEGGKTRIRVSLAIGATPLDAPPDAEALKNRLTSDIAGVIGVCQRLGVEPFGFAETAAKRYRTTAEWEKSDWLRQFREADISVSVDLTVFK